MVAPVERATAKTIDIGGEMWTIRKLPALDGLYLGYVILNSALPPIITQSLGGELGDVAATGKPMGKADFESLTRDLLKATAKKLASGWVDTIDAAGNFQVPGLETDMATCLRLMIEVISFNFRDFFADAGLLDAVGGLFGMSRQSTKA